MATVSSDVGSLSLSGRRRGEEGREGGGRAGGSRFSGDSASGCRSSLYPPFSEEAKEREMPYVLAHENFSLDREKRRDEPLPT